jgi:hypothetical protein
MRLIHVLMTLPLPGLLARMLAVMAMLVQVVFSAEHNGAVAAKSLGGFAPEARFGFIEICTGNGVARILPDGSGPVQGSDCPICSNASVFGFSQPETLDAPALPLLVLSADLQPCTPASLTSAPFPGTKPIRAPPLA